MLAAALHNARSSSDVIIKISHFENLYTLLEHYMKCFCMKLIFLFIITVIIIVFHSYIVYNLYTQVEEQNMLQFGQH
jgi:hypothetical protein